MEKRYQVFISSTYADLKEERRNVIQTLMEMDCIPAGMELFPATDEDQFEFIKRVIDDCDYYLVIVGGRYGSTTTEGISYTEKEYDYAVNKGLKVIALLHENPDNIPVGKSDIDPELRTRLTAFREKLSAGRLVKFWSKTEDLPGLVALSLSKMIKMFPAVGWMRANKVGNEELLSELNDARKENNALREEISKIEIQPVETMPNLANLDELFIINGKCTVTRYDRRHTESWSITLSWQEIFGYIAPYLLAYPTDTSVETALRRTIVEAKNISGSSHSIRNQDFETIKVQLKAHGLVNVSYQKTVQGGMALFWSLTSSGEELMMRLRTIKTNAAA